MKIKQMLMIALTSGALMVGASFASAQKSDIPPDLAKQAKVSLEAARTTALAKVPGGEIKSEELEREHGHLIYSFDIQVPGKSGVEEVHVNAINGKVIGKKHESAKKEMKEEKKEEKHKEG
ncbi:MAG TPA: PepSY domain-containing protein [Thermoanaerobaculia bacterium]|jgi:uncharacterized membrane protein YkoI|nr:PepSY domain-containing protein [Thermoanaerobaculia bacterium]